MYSKSFIMKVVSIFVLVCFSWVFAGGVDIAQAVSPHDTASNRVSSRSISKANSSAKKLNNTINSLETDLNDTSLSKKEKKSKVTKRISELGDIDSGFQIEFEKTQKHIKDEKLSDDILKRHEGFVNDYKTKFTEFKGKLKEIENASDCYWHNGYRALYELDGWF
ncbi:MAG: hypothetical protein L3V56_14360 [Candidatus Magnetoovum sp. WYHC-5]|nr:hypothetical protein [Candidatus Magnetoovum sp. WYHC-5]